MPILVLGIDLGKNSCSVVGLDASGAVYRNSAECARGTLRPSPKTSLPASLWWKRVAARIISVVCWRRKGMGFD